MRRIVFVSAIMLLLLAGCRGGNSKTGTERLSAQMAVEGVSNYCHSEFDWSVAQENPSMMYVALGVENEAGSIDLRDYLDL